MLDYRQIAWILIVGIPFIYIVVWMNVEYYKHRRSLTPEQRLEFDERISDELRIW